MTQGPDPRVLMVKWWSYSILNNHYLTIIIQSLTDSVDYWLIDGVMSRHLVDLVPSDWQYWSWHDLSAHGWNEPGVERQKYLTYEAMNTLPVRACQFCNLSPEWSQRANPQQLARQAPRLGTAPAEEAYWVGPIWFPLSHYSCLWERGLSYHHRILCTIIIILNRVEEREPMAWLWVSETLTATKRCLPRLASSVSVTLH